MNCFTGMKNTGQSEGKRPCQDHDLSKSNAVKSSSTGPAPFPTNGGTFCTDSPSEYFISSPPFEARL